MLTLSLSMLTAPAAAAVLVGEPGRSSPACHDDGTPCPDNGGEAPCDGDCPCLCCLGHRTIPTLTAGVDLLDGEHFSTYLFVSSESAHPAGIVQRLFRPPIS
jgi:hypothetical protein